MKWLSIVFLCIVMCYQLLGQETSMPKIIYLNGPSSSGKTTIAKTLQESFSEPYLHLGIDKIIGFMPWKINNWEGGVAPLGFSWEPAKDPTGHPIYQIKAGPYAKKITRTLKDIAHLLAAHGYNLIIDDVAFGAIEVEEWKSALKNYDVLYVGITTPLEVLEQREQSRGDRFLGSARGQYFKVHENVAYDLEIDTYSHTIEANVAKIQAALSKKFSTGGSMVSGEMEKRKIVESYLSLYNTFQIPQMVDLFADDCIFQNVTNGSVAVETHGKEELMRLAKQGASVFKERKQSATNWIIEKNKVTVEIDYEATLAQDLPNGAKKGTHLKLKGVSIFEFQSGKIKRLVDIS